MGPVPIPPIRVFDEGACPYGSWRAAASHFACDALRDLPALLVNNGRDALVPLGGAVVQGEAADDAGRDRKSVV